MIRRTLLVSALLAAGLCAFPAVQAADITIVNQDVGTGQGLDDHTPVAPVGGNPGTTRGEQALIVFQFAADLWGAVLHSDVPIINTVTFQPLSCNATSGVLGSSGTNYIFSFNAGDTLPQGALADTWYHSALADALAGTDLGVENELPPNTPDIVSRFNGKLGSTGCLEGSAWYFGIDGNTPAGQINFLDVVTHEMAHGLGFSGFNDLSTGQQNQDQQDIYSSFVKDNTTGQFWTAMTDAERMTAALDDGHLVFTGTNVKAEAPLALEAPVLFQVTAPAAIAGNYAYDAAAFGPAPAPGNFNGDVAVPGGDPQACNVSGASAPVAGVSGKIALIDRGTCAFVEKAANAQAGGAVGVVIANTDDTQIIPSGDDPSITIPVIAVSHTTGVTFKANLSGLHVQLAQSTGLAGADADGNVQLYAPTTLAQGSSFSHYDTRLSPNAIMEYAINADLEANLDLDLTPALFKDIGWGVDRGNQFLLDCDTGVPVSTAGGLIVGANIYGTAKVLAGAAADVGSYRQAIRAHADELAGEGLLTVDQASSLNQCLSDEATEAQFEEWGGDTGGTPGGDTAIVLTNGVAMAGQAGSAGVATVYKLDVPAGALALNLRTYGGTGDVSVYVKVGAPGGPEDYDYKSVHRGNNEAVANTRPVAGTYYVTVVGETAYSGLGVMGSFLQVLR
ncbi:PA domain-containing protein [Frateuria hangzhouensis]|uniref:PA domain-containing protein n=1 Tax=Frateuria hangzhouensis TaxID=2995589 RepID=UPI002B207D0C|nr:PA domain-containing protein [Frateuria sp. STR12]